MGKVSYANMKLKVKNNVKTFKFQDNDIEVIQYLSSEDKYSLINITLQKSLEDGFYNPLKLDVYFHLHLVYMYTDISFTEKQKEDEFKIFDTLKNNNFIDLMLANIPEDEYNYLLKIMEETIEKNEKYKNTVAGIMSKLIDDLPTNAQAAMDIVNNFDEDKFQDAWDIEDWLNDSFLDYRDLISKGLALAAPEGMYNIEGL